MVDVLSPADSLAVNVPTNQGSAPSAEVHGKASDPMSTASNTGSDAFLRKSKVLFMGA
jgi:hypothetical protein